MLTFKNSSDKIYRNFALRKNPEKKISLIPFVKADKLVNSRAYISSCKGIRFYERLQHEQGFWPGDYGGPMFLLPNFVIFLHVTGTVLDPEYVDKMLMYMKNHQNDDGGWGTHIQSSTSTMFGTVMNYVAVRLLGVDKFEPWIIRARSFILKNGGAVNNAPWGKFWLSILGIHEWDGLNTLLPDLWLLPEVVPLHPCRWWCHCRMVYMPMAFAFAKKIKAKQTSITQSLREEIYCEPYAKINWKKHRSSVSAVDQYYTKNKYVLKFCFFFANLYERFHLKGIRSRAAEFLLNYIRMEDDQTDHVNLGPINKILNALCIWNEEGPNSLRFKKHVDRIWDYLWLAEDGLKMQGYNGSQFWDTSFAMIAISINLKHSNEFAECFLKAYSYVDYSQIRSDAKNRNTSYRHFSKGGWPFSTLSHNWPISDCTSHGLYAVLLAHELGIVTGKNKITDERLFDSVDLILTLQNPDGGFPTYENQRGSSLLELLNPAVTFDKIMVDYSYVECTSSALFALAKFSKCYPHYRSDDIEAAMKSSVEYIKSQMRPDGSWYGSWGVCFTYAAFFAMTALIMCGEDSRGETISKAIAFLLGKQKEDGGWGETFESCTRKEYTQNTKSQVVNTAWALIALMNSGCKDVNKIKKGIKLLIERQQESGDWLQEDISGVFNANCMITYTSYRNIFPIWALSLFAEKYGDK